MKDASILKETKEGLIMKDSKRRSEAGEACVGFLATIIVGAPACVAFAWVSVKLGL